MSEILELIPIGETLESNEDFVKNPVCLETIYMTIEFYKKIGYTPPWIGYYVKKDSELVGSCAFKGKPINGSIEIAYGTFEKYRQQGIGTAMCKLLTDLALKTDPDVRVTARTPAEENFSTRILQKNDFFLAGTVNDPEDGDVWEWVYRGRK